MTAKPIRNRGTGTADRPPDVIFQVIGERGRLSKKEARASAELWRDLVQQNPRALFIISVLGYDDDPRDIWEFPDAVRYVGWWARYAGMDNFETAKRLLEPLPGREHSSALGFLAACGVFGEEAKRVALNDWSPTVAH
jgi:hypothetical protein